jgi:hypothetical protein
MPESDTKIDPLPEKEDGDADSNDHNDDTVSSTCSTVPGQPITDFGALQVGMFVLVACGESVKHRFPAEIISVSTEGSELVFTIQYYHYPVPGSAKGFIAEPVTRPAFSSDLLSILRSPTVEAITASRKKIMFDKL